MGTGNSFLPAFLGLSPATPEQFDLELVKFLYCYLEYQYRIDALSESFCETFNFRLSGWYAFEDICVLEQLSGSL